MYEPLVLFAAYLHVGLVIHMTADWLLQNDWMARNKVNLKHPAAWVHSGIHALMFLLVFHWSLALLIGILHMLIDTRKPVRTWQTFYKQTTDGPAAIIIAMVVDQVFHGLVVVAAAIIQVLRF